LKKHKLVTDTWTVDGKSFVNDRDPVVVANNVTALNKLASEIGRDAVIRAQQTKILTGAHLS